MVDEHHSPQRPPEVVLPDTGGWISGPCIEPDGEIPRLDMMMTGDLLAEMYPDWEITRDEVFGVWQAERRRGSEVHFLAAVEAWELATKIKAAGQAEQ